MNITSPWIRLIRLWWTTGFTLACLLNLDQFAYAAGLGPAPKYWIVGIFAVTFGLFLPGLKPGQLVRKPLVGWSACYLLLSVVWIGHAENLEAAIDGLMMVITTTLLVGTALLAYPLVPHGNRTWNAMLWVALLLAVLSIMQEYFNPAAYVFAEAGQGIKGRAAGAYLNPNTAAQTLIMILACLMAHGSARANVIALVLSAVGILLTFSRGGMLAWIILVIAATIRGRLPRWFLAVLVLCAATVLLAGPWVLDSLSVWVSPENRNSLDRLAWLLGQGSLDDYSSDERAFVAAYAWRQFLDAPFFGHGLGYMWVWASSQGSHNMSLRFMAEYGLLGAMILPLFLFASIRSSPADADHRWLWLMAGVVMLLSLFSHNMSEQAAFLLPWLAICLMPRHASRDVQH
jgi:hypothetical protein